MKPDPSEVIWTHYSYGYEARFSRYGKAFARARMVNGEPGIHYELVWIYGPSKWGQLRVLNIMTIERQVERYVKHHREFIIRKMPPTWRDETDENSLFEVGNTKNHGPVVGDVARNSCKFCGRTRGLCSRTLSTPARRAGHFGWPCAA